MNLNLMAFLVGKAVSDKLGEQRSTQLGLIAGMMSGFQGVMISALIASREEPTATPVVDPKALAAQVELLRKLLADLSHPGTGLTTSSGAPRT